MKALSMFCLLAILMFGFAVGSAQTGSPPPDISMPVIKGLPEQETSTAPEIEVLYLPSEGGFAAPATSPSVDPASYTRISEIEPNNTINTANLLPASYVSVTGNIFPNGDSDFFAFSAAAGDRVYAAVQTSFSASNNFDSQLSLLDALGSVLEFDNDDGSFGGTSSSIAGASIPAAGTFYLQVNHGSPTGSLRPYVLYLRVQSGASSAEVEPNNNTTLATPLSANGWISGSLSPASDTDFFSLSLNAGDTVFLSLDLDPERDAVTWNGRIGIGVFGSYLLVASDNNVTSPNSEAFFLTVKDSGTYFVYVDEPAAQAGSTYRLSVSVIPAAVPTGACTTYTSSNALAIPDNASTPSTINIPLGSGTIADLDIALSLTHANIPDLDLTLQAPGGNQVGLLTDIGSSAMVNMDLVLDDEAAIPVGAFTVLSGIRYQPELSYRLSWFDGQAASGAWTLTLTDDLAGNTGTLNSWSLTVCQPPPQSTCRGGIQPVVVFSTDFEANDGGFTHLGAQDEWEYGTPAFAPVTTCASGTHCWKTDLDNTYNASSSQDLLSPAISLVDLAGPVILSWAQKYQMETANFDHASVNAFEIDDGVSSQPRWEWLDATMTTAIGATTVNESAGWGAYKRDISDLAGRLMQVRFHVDSDTSVNLAGLAIDDVTVTACRPSIHLPLVFKLAP